MYFKGQDELPLIIFFTKTMMRYISLESCSLSNSLANGETSYDESQINKGNHTNWLSVINLKYGQNDGTCGMTYSKPYYIKIAMKEKDTKVYLGNETNPKSLNFYEYYNNHTRSDDKTFFRSKFHQHELFLMSSPYLLKSVLSKNHESLTRYINDNKGKKNALDEVKNLDHLVTPIMPIIFIPGHMGSYKQARSLNAHLEQYFLSKGKSSLNYKILNETFLRGKLSGAENLSQNESKEILYVLFTLDFKEEPSALHGSLLWRQASTINNAIHSIDQYFSSMWSKVIEENSADEKEKNSAELLRIQTSESEVKRISNEKLMTPPSNEVILVGHSTGGIVARLAPLLSTYTPNSIHSILTIGSPHMSSSWTLDSSLRETYNYVTIQWRRRALKSLKVSSEKKKKNATKDPRVTVGKNAYNKPLAKTIELHESIPLINFIGGDKDHLVAPTLSLYMHQLDPELTLDIPTRLLKNVQSDISHSALVWCYEFLDSLVNVITHLSHSDFHYEDRNKRKNTDKSTENNKNPLKLESGINSENMNLLNKRRQVISNIREEFLLLDINESRINLKGQRDFYHESSKAVYAFTPEIYDPVLRGGDKGLEFARKKNVKAPQYGYHGEKKVDPVSSCIPNDNGSLFIKVMSYGKYFSEKFIEQLNGLTKNILNFDSEDFIVLIVQLTRDDSQWFIGLYSTILFLALQCYFFPLFYEYYFKADDYQQHSNLHKHSFENKYLSNEEGVSEQPLSALLWITNTSNYKNKTLYSSLISLPTVIGFVLWSLTKQSFTKEIKYFFPLHLFRLEEWNIGEEEKKEEIKRNFIDYVYFQFKKPFGFHHDGKESIMTFTSDQLSGPVILLLCFFVTEFALNILTIIRDVNRNIKTVNPHENKRRSSKSSSISGSNNNKIDTRPVEEDLFEISPNSQDQGAVSPLKEEINKINNEANKKYNYFYYDIILRNFFYI